MSSLWFTFLYQPVFNALIWIYSNVAHENLGWAVVWLTIFLRIALLPLTILSEYNQARRELAEAEAVKAIKAYKNDRVAQQEVIRKVMRKYHVSPWARVASLGIQLLVFILLYQVFIGGITGEKMIKNLYTWVDFPGHVNIMFYGFDIGHRHDYLWAGICALYLLVGIFIENRSKSWDRAGMYYLIFFPLFTFSILWYLPMVKSLFILTTMVFSDIITIIRHVFFKPKPAGEAAHGGGHH
jgi:membrane protein insertase Oxa1/YidC/SpoIIIJ